MGCAPQPCPHLPKISPRVGSLSLYFTKNKRSNHTPPTMPVPLKFCKSRILINPKLGQALLSPGINSSAVQQSGVGGAGKIVPQRIQSPEPGSRHLSRSWALQRRVLSLPAFLTTTLTLGQNSVLKCSRGKSADHLDRDEVTDPFLGVDVTATGGGASGLNPGFWKRHTVLPACHLKLRYLA